MSTKYIKDKNNNIIVFSEDIMHSQFKHMEPKSAGFISFGHGKIGNTVCQCWGESVSLRLKSDPHDTYLANVQIAGISPYEMEDNI